MDVRANYVRVYSPNSAQSLNVDETQFYKGAAANLIPQMEV
jgi:hypothetical protein